MLCAAFGLADYMAALLAECNAADIEDMVTAHATEHGYNNLSADASIATRPRKWGVCASDVAADQTCA